MRRSTRNAAKAVNVNIPSPNTKRKRTSVSSNLNTANKRTRRTTGDATDKSTSTPRVDPASITTLSDSLADPTETKDRRLADKKWQAWSAHGTSSPFPDFTHPTPHECTIAHRVLKEMHQDAVDAESKDPDLPETIPHVLDAIIVAILSQATGWSNAKRAMYNMRDVYGSVFAYDAIQAGGLEKLQETLRPGGLHVRKGKLIWGVLEQMQERHGKWDLDYLFEKTDDEAMQELMRYKGMGPKSAFVVLGWCLKRNPFTVDTHVYRIAGLWGWRPHDASRESTQKHLDAVVPRELKFDLHFLLIQHGRTCPVCRGGSKSKEKCVAREKMDMLG
ncbi:putative HhH-GPD superfamily base excision DNA repair protein-2 [Elsinoe australis]|uniref:Putative HhH-GPD superfamily base excision DNA repair protein-2 n=1 Tax=Elsinoe australis TaxID=40998 RepID=A0A4U7AUI3_9PEZI|nr:putative HhH-GPD superfamily base excision DNA repair protein-2 [Elsinoe australis]